jgi:hypothetical protein
MGMPRCQPHHLKSGQLKPLEGDTSDATDVVKKRMFQKVGRRRARLRIDCKHLDKVKREGWGG